MYKHWKKILLAMTAFFWNAYDNNSTPTAPQITPNSSSGTNVIIKDKIYKCSDGKVYNEAEFKARYDVMTCVNRKNLNELPQIFNLLVNLGVKRWRVSNVFPKGRAKDNPLFQLSNEEFRQVFEFIRETKTKKIINVNYDCEGFLGSYEKVVRDQPFFFAGRA